MRWARLSERAHLSAAGPSIDTRAVLLPDEGVGRVVVERGPVTQLLEHERDARG